MTPEERAASAVRIATSLQARLVGDVMATTQDMAERHQLIAGAIALLLRRITRDLPSLGDRAAWLEGILKATVA